MALQAEGKLSEAEDIDTRTLAIRRKRLGHENAQIAVSLNNLGSVYRDRGKLKQAKAATLDALEMRQKLFGSPSLEVADSLRNLSLILGDERDWPAAANAREVLAIRRKLLGSEHPWIASALADVAWAVREGHTNRPKQHRWKEKLWPCVKSS